MSRSVPAGDILSELQPSPENDQLYRPVDPADPEIEALAASIRRHGLREPLVVSLDGFILSGHRRHCAARLAGLTTVPVRVEQIRRSDDLDRFVVLLREYNRQRDKSYDEKLREKLVTVDPHEAYESLIAHRRERAMTQAEAIPLRERKTRATISKGKQPMLDAVVRVVMSMRDFWPISERTIHYHLLNDPPRRHASKPGSTYRNDKRSYHDLSNLCTRGRLIGAIPFEAISDETRPVTTWTVHADPRAFIRSELDAMFKGYWRDLMRSQPNHIEIVAEKNTVEPILRNVAMQYCIPITSGRGFGSLPPRKAMADRYERSGKEKLILVVMSDFDPAGEEIAHSLARSMRDDFGIDAIHAIKAGLTFDQVRTLDLKTDFQAKRTDPNYKRFVAKYGTDVFELEAVRPEKLQELLRATLDAVIDRAAFNAELDAEKADAAYLATVRKNVASSLKDLSA